MKEVKPTALATTARPATPSSGGVRRTPSYLRMTYLLGNPLTSALPSLPYPVDSRASRHSTVSLDAPRLGPSLSENRLSPSKVEDDINEDLMASLGCLSPAKTLHQVGDYAQHLDRDMPKRPPRPESGILLPEDPGTSSSKSAEARISNGSDPSGAGKLQLPYEFADIDLGLHRSPSLHSQRGTLTNLPSPPILPGLPAVPHFMHDRAHAPGPVGPRRKQSNSLRPSPRPSPSGSPPKLPPPSPIEPLPTVPSKSSGRTYRKSPSPAAGTNIAHMPSTLPYAFADDEPDDPVPRAHVRANVQQWQWEEAADSS